MKNIVTAITLFTVITGCSVSTNNSNVKEKKEITLKFKAMADNKDIECGKSYENIGIKKSKLSIMDFRVYLHNIRLIDEKGNEKKIEIEQDKKWHDGDLVLLDFENKKGDCSSGTSETHTEVKGSIEKGNYKGLKFTLGVPFDKNHQDVAKANSPLNLTSMFWVWNSGYKFARIDLKTDKFPQGYFIHLGSTGCMNMEVKHETGHGDDAETPMTPPSMCKNPNRPEIVINDFNPDSNNIIMDLSSLLSNTDIDINTPNTPSGCMSGIDDPDCKGIMNNFGLDFVDTKSSGQIFFKSGV